ncbi:MAG TPA: twin-arginine translocase TatA/TatE family subunit [Pseudobdellovibrionaceae bacterium]|nr:twin-arginine translocase TatA/TatE family subunit [Pseudobdellovibrionaceae bacterium]
MGLGIWEIGLIVFAALLVFGPKQLPGLGKSLGQAIRGLKDALGEAQNAMNDASGDSAKSANKSQIRDAEPVETESSTEKQTNKS